MEEFELALKLKRAMRAYSYNSIDESRGLGVFKDLINGKVTVEVSFNGDTLQFMPHKCVDPAATKETVPTPISETPTRIRKTKVENEAETNHQ